MNRDLLCLLASGSLKLDKLARVPLPIPAEESEHQMVFGLDLSCVCACATDF